jgi:hypothetical protein
MWETLAFFREKYSPGFALSYAFLTISEIASTFILCIASFSLLISNTGLGLLHETIIARLFSLSFFQLAFSSCA